MAGRGWPRRYVATGRTAEALVAARERLGGATFRPADEGLLLRRFGPQLTAADYDRRIDALLFAKRASDAQRAAGLGPARRGALRSTPALPC